MGRFGWWNNVNENRFWFDSLLDAWNSLIVRSICGGNELQVYFDLKYPLNEEMSILLLH